MLGLRQFAVARHGREREAHSSGRGDQPLNRNHHASTTSQSEYNQPTKKRPVADEDDWTRSYQSLDDTAFTFVTADFFFIIRKRPDVVNRLNALVVGVVTQNV